MTVFAAFVLTRQVCPRILKALDEGFIIEPQSVSIINWIDWILASYFHNLWTYQQLLCRSIKSNFELKNYLKINFVQSIILQRRIVKYGIKEKRVWNDNTLVQWSILCLSIHQYCSIIVSSKSSSEVLDTPQSATCSECKKMWFVVSLFTLAIYLCHKAFSNQIQSWYLSLDGTTKSWNLLALFFLILFTNDEFW